MEGDRWEFKVCTASWRKIGAIYPMLWLSKGNYATGIIVGRREFILTYCVSIIKWTTVPLLFLRFPLCHCCVGHSCLYEIHCCNVNYRKKSWCLVMGKGGPCRGLRGSPLALWQEENIRHSRKHVQVQNLLYTESYIKWNRNSERVRSLTEYAAPKIVVLLYLSIARLDMSRVLRPRASETFLPFNTLLGSCRGVVEVLSTKGSLTPRKLDPIFYTNFNTKH